MTDRTMKAALGLALILAGLDFLPASVSAQAPYVSPSQARMKADVTFLAADAQDGRAPGSKGIEASAEHVADSFRASGLKAAPSLDGFFQAFNVKGNPVLVAPPSLVFRYKDGRVIQPAPGTFQPLGIGGGDRFEGVSVVFAGYGITAKDESSHLDYDDYAGIDVKGKAVIVLRREPQLDDENSPFAGKMTTMFATYMHKATNAFQHGAAAVFLVNDLAGLKGAEDRAFRFDSAGFDEYSSIPYIYLARAEADKLLNAAGQPNLESLERQIDSDLKPRSRVLDGLTMTGSVDIVRPPVPTRNVIGVLEGAGPFAEETIVVGAHYDHLGHGEPGSGSLSLRPNEIHNGADDNASGTALVMELARRLAARAEPLPRRIVFMAFSGEEKGLIGSRYYVDHPSYPLDRTVMMINFDMVGRLNGKGELTIVGTGSSPGLEQVVDAVGSAAGFKVKKVKGMTDGFGGSDHESFYLKGVPILFPFTGLHSDYHRPSDDTERINFAGMDRIGDFAEVLLLDVARRPTRPLFTKAPEASQNPHGTGTSVDPGRVGMGAYLGTIPDYAAEDKGVKLSGVNAGSPAEKGGIKGGDVIVGFAGKPVATIYDYTDLLGRNKPGDKVEIIVKRDGKDVTLNVTLGSRPGR